jgi:hypothetical protein
MKGIPNMEEGAPIMFSFFKHDITEGLFHADILPFKKTFGVYRTALSR